MTSDNGWRGWKPTMPKPLRRWVDAFLARLMEQSAVCDFCGDDNLATAPGVQSIVCEDCLDVMVEYGVIEVIG